jgi:hypothetical protein
LRSVSQRLFDPAQTVLKKPPRPIVPWAFLYALFLRDSGNRGVQYSGLYA